MKRPEVRNREEFLAFLAELRYQVGRGEAENEDLSSYLEAGAAWLEDADGFYRNIGADRDPAEASWQLFADMLSAALIYE